MINLLLELKVHQRRYLMMNAKANFYLVTISRYYSRLPFYQVLKYQYKRTIKI